MNEALTEFRDLAVAKQPDAIALLAYHPTRKEWCAAVLHGPNDGDSEHWYANDPQEALAVALASLKSKEIV